MVKGFVSALTWVVFQERKKACGIQFSPPLLFFSQQTLQQWLKVSKTAFVLGPESGQIPSLWVCGKVNKWKSRISITEAISYTSTKTNVKKNRPAVTVIILEVKIWMGTTLENMVLTTVAGNICPALVSLSKKLNLHWLQFCSWSRLLTSHVWC